MEPDDERERAPQRKGISYSEPLAQAAYARHAALCSHSLDDDPIASASAHRHDPARCVSFPHQLPSHHHHSRGGESMYLHAASFSGGRAVALERAVATSEYGGALPEFVGAGGGEGIFRVPLRAAMHPGRPPALEVRPHPPRETQVCSFLRTLACEPQLRQLWAGTESGVRMWGLDELFAGSVVPGARRGDEETAPFTESVPAPPALCVAVDSANKLVWTGHKDGRIRSWRMDLAAAPAAAADGGENAPMFKEALSWQAHSRTPVLSMVVTSYGMLGQGSC